MVFTEAEQGPVRSVPADLVPPTPLKSENITQRDEYPSNPPPQIATQAVCDFSKPEYGNSGTVWPATAVCLHVVKPEIRFDQFEHVVTLLCVRVCVCRCVCCVLPNVQTNIADCKEIGSLLTWSISIVYFLLGNEKCR